MAGYVKLLRSIWHDDDFVRLTATQQRLYMLLLSQPDMSHCGVLAITPARWARLSSDTTPAEIRADLAELVQNRFVVVDEDTEELWIRTWMAYDGGFRVPNTAKAISTALTAIMSPTIREQAVCAALTLGVTLEPTLSARVSVRVSPTLSATLGPRVRLTQELTQGLSQQPAAISQQPKASSQQPADAAAAAAAPEGAHAEALALWIAARVNKPDVRNARKLQEHLQRNASVEWWTLLDQHKDANPDASVAQVLWEVFKMKGEY